MADKPTAQRQREYRPREEHVVSNYMSRVRSSGSAMERHLGSALWRAGLRYRKQHPVPGRPDFAFPRQRVAVFCDSHFWHGYLWETKGKYAIRKRPEFWIPKIETNIRRDRDVERQLGDLGWTVLRFWEHEVFDDTDRCVSRVQEAVRAGQPT